MSIAVFTKRHCRTGQYPFDDLCLEIYLGFCCRAVDGTVQRQGDNPGLATNNTGNSRAIDGAVKGAVNQGALGIQGSDRSRAVSCAADGTLGRAGVRSEQPGGGGAVDSATESLLDSQRLSSDTIGGCGAIDSAVKCSLDSGISAVDGGVGGDGGMVPFMASSSAPMELLIASLAVPVTPVLSWACSRLICC